MITDILTSWVLPTIAGLAFVCIPFWWCERRGESIESYGLSWTVDRRGAVLCAAALAFVLVPLTFVSMRWPLESLPRSSSLRRTLELAASGVGAAIIEEVFFRAWIYPLFRKKFGAAASIVCTSAIFALAHIFVAQTVFLFAVFFPGAVMAWLRERTGNIGASTVFHGTCNIWAIWFAPLVWPAPEALLDTVLKIFA